MSRVGGSNQRAQATLPDEVWHDGRDIIAANDCTPKIRAALQCGVAVRPMDLAFVVSRLSIAITGKEDIDRIIALNQDIVDSLASQPDID